MQTRIVAILLFVSIGCRPKHDNSKHTASLGPAETKINLQTPEINFISEIKTPTGFKRVSEINGSFASWLRMIPLKNDKTVYLYNGKMKPNQTAQYAVIDLPTGNKDLQQCADVVMKLRAEYLFNSERYNEIAFMDYSGKWYKWTGRNNRIAFEDYLQTVFGWCGSASLEKQLKAVSIFNMINSGDVLVQGGFPGHAVIVVDVAINDKGEKIYLLAQGYQPAQDMHVLRNPTDHKLDPWYAVNREEEIMTPEWKFQKSNLKTW